MAAVRRGAPDAVTQGADPQTEGKTAKPKTPKLTSVKRKAGTKAVIRWKKAAGADGYEIQMSTSKNKGFKNSYLKLLIIKLHNQ